MKKIQRHIEIIRSSTVELSSLSLESCSAIYDLLRANYTLVGISTVNNQHDLELLAAKHPDLVFMGMKFIPDGNGREIWIADYLEANGIAYTGSPQEAHELELNKALAKECIQNDGLNTAAFTIVANGKSYDKAGNSLRFPLFVKPASLGGGAGIDASSVAGNMNDLQAKIDTLATKFSSDVLIEEYLPGREFSVALLENDSTGELMTMPIELVTMDNEHGHRILSQEIKSSNQEKVLRIATNEMRSAVTTLAENVFRALGARDYGRIDIRLDASGVPHFLEANLIPSLIRGYGSFPKACYLNMGMDYDEMILRIVRLGLSRSRNESVLLEAPLLTPLLLPAPAL